MVPKARLKASTIDQVAAHTIRRTPPRLATQVWETPSPDEKPTSEVVKCLVSTLRLPRVLWSSADQSRDHPESHDRTAVLFSPFSAFSRFVIRMAKYAAVIAPTSPNAAVTTKKALLAPATSSPNPL